MKRPFYIVIQEYLHTEQKSQKEVAQMLGVSTGLVNDWVQGRSQPGYDSLQEIVVKLGLSAEYALGLSE